jgi:radical SAM superfamily enzyme YgiQ (UPF0313 family)
MSWKIIAKLKSRLAAESGALLTRRGAALRICLVYPNYYRLGMSNLGFQAVHAIFNATPGILCERAFLPDPDDRREHEQSHTPLLSLESRQPVAGFDIIAFSISFESDYLHLPAIFRLAGLSPLSADRNGKDPLIMAGGAALFLNPEPVADFIDVICLGEAEVLLPALTTAFAAGAPLRDSLQALLGTIPGIYLPGQEKKPVVRQYLAALDSCATATTISSPETEFADLHLLELSRGCPRGCRFCAAGFIYLPYRQRSLAAVKREADKAIQAGRKIGLVAAAVGDYRGIDELCRHIVASGGRFSVSSLRIDGLDETMIDLLVASGHKTATLAPEGGSQRLRDLIKKGINEEQILAACERLIAKDILNLKLYFIIGLPTETDDDIAELLALVAKIRELVVARAKANRRLGEITLSVNPFIPKPFTPFQWCGMQPQRTLEKRLELLKKGVRPLANVSLQAESLKESLLQALLSRGDRRLSAFILKADEAGSWRRGARELGLDVEKEATRAIPLDEELPWGFIEGTPAELLKREYRLAFPG